VERTELLRRILAESSGLGPSHRARTTARWPDREQIPCGDAARVSRRVDQLARRSAVLGHPIGGRAAARL